MFFKNIINKPFVIAEIGHNHQGNINLAFELIRQAKICGADAVKFQKRNNKKLFTKKFYNEKYENENSYGETYGKHRDFLEFDFEQFKELKAFSISQKIEFFATPFDFESVDFLEKLDVSAYKIASADLTNIPLQNEISKLKKPIFLSTGGGTIEDVKRAVNNIAKYNTELSIMHCTASYPADIEDMNLRVINVYKKEFKDFVIGLSDHENGIDAAPIAYMLGARTFEKHFTLNRANKGTDHAFSLEPYGLSRLIRNLNRIEKMLGVEEKKLLEKEKKPLFKMKKSIVANKNLLKDHILKVEDISFKSPGGGLEPYEYIKIIGRKLKKSLSEDDLILNKDLE